MADKPKEGETQAPTPEELKQEEEALAEQKEEDIRTGLIAKFELDEDSQGDLIDKLTQEAVEQQKSFGKVVGQKRSWREKAIALEPETKDPDPKDPDPKDPDPSDANDKESDTLTREEAILLAKGMDEDDLDQLKKIAAFNETTILEAQDDPLYTAYQTQKVEAKKKEEAELGASGGSGAHSKGGAKPGMSDEDHRKLWEESRGN